MTIRLALVPIIILCAWASSAHAQIKIGYVNVEYIYSMMPEAKAAQDRVNQRQTALQRRLRQLQAEYDTLYNDYAQSSQQGTRTPLEMRDLERQLEQKRDTILRETRRAEMSLLEYSADQRRPVIEKLTREIQAAAKAGDYGLVLNQEAIAYTTGDNLTPVVLRRMNIRTSAVPETPQNSELQTALPAEQVKFEVTLPPLPKASVAKPTQN